MIRVVIDTNLLVSALLTRGGLPEAVINLAISSCFRKNRFSAIKEVGDRNRTVNKGMRLEKPEPEPIQREL